LWKNKLEKKAEGQKKKEKGKEIVGISDEGD